MKASWTMSLLALLAFSAMAELRVAIVPLDDADRSQADMLLAELGDEPDVAFLERAEIDKIRQEMQLSSLSDFMPDPHQMQNTQLFLLLTGNQVMAFDCRTGVRLLDRNFQETAGLTEAVRDAIEKERAFSADGLKKISVMSLVPVELNDSQEKLARQAETLLLQRLCARRDLVLLERRHLMHLLMEPNAAERRLTDQLFAGACLMKPMAVAEGPRGILVKIQFYSSDGNRLLDTKELPIAGAEGLDKAVEDFLGSLALPDGNEDKKGEAAQFIQEAWFASAHGLEGHALSSGASAAALDDNYGRELARIAFLSAARILADAQRLDARRIDMALDDMCLGERLTERHGGYSRGGVNAATWICDGDGHSFFAMSPQQQRRYRETFEKMVLHRVRQLDSEVLPFANAEGPRWPNGVFRVESMAQYAQELHKFCYRRWELSPWLEHAYPALERFIDMYNDMLPEIERFSRLGLEETRRVIREPDVRGLRTPRNRKFGGMNMMENTYPLHFLEPANLPTWERRAMEGACLRMCSSRYLPLAMNGLTAMMRLRCGDSFPYARSALNDERRRDMALYYAELKRILGEVSPAFVNWDDGLVAADGFLNEMLEIEDIAVRRLCWHDPFKEGLLLNCEKWSPQTAGDVYRKLEEWEKESLADIGAHDLFEPIRKQRVKDYFRQQQAKLEKLFRFEREDIEKTPVGNPYAMAYSPFEGDTQIKGIVYAGCEGGSVYLFAMRRRGMLSLERIGLDAPACARQMAETSLPEPGCECLFGAVLDDGYAAFLTAAERAWICLFPKTGGEPETFSFTEQGQGRYTSFCGGGDSLFLSCGGENQFAGKLVQCNVRNRETKVLASTLDRSVEWPLKGINHPCVIEPLIYDADNRRIVTLMNSKPHPPAGEVIYDMALWAYYWETGEWKAISNFLPCSTFEFGPYLRLVDGEFWLACNYGFGRINGEGNFQPVFLIGADGHLSDAPIRYGSSSFEKVVVDLSRIRPPDRRYGDLKGFSDLEFRAFNGGVYWGRKAIMLMQGQRFLRVDDGFWITDCIGERYCLGWVGGMINQGEFQIRVLKPEDEI